MKTFLLNVDDQATEEGMIPAPAATAVMSEVSNHPSSITQGDSPCLFWETLRNP